MRISVAASHVEPIDMRLHGGWGSVAAPPLASDAAQDDGETLCCAVSGAAADGSGDGWRCHRPRRQCRALTVGRGATRALLLQAALAEPRRRRPAPNPRPDCRRRPSLGRPVPPRHAFHQHESRPWRCHRPRRERRALLFRSNCVTMSPFDIGKRSEGGLCVSCGSVS